MLSVTMSSCRSTPSLARRTWRMRTTIHQSNSEIYGLYCSVNMWSISSDLPMKLLLQLALIAGEFELNSGWNEVLTRLK